ncbi:MAG: hypothetical protein KJ799_18690 [Bacteroidetes bacterium]|nr:hypothetical protein [Bacteroidota bacterium]MBU1678649.1 hypothetical protein [Bacteroidota bacterium]MBU2508726.1 hypothetical protein [Bacteroidota bacterium]
MEYSKYTLVLFMRDKENPFVYEISAAEKERFNNISDLSISEGPEKSFFCFETTNGLQVAVSISHIQFAHNLYDPDIEKILTKLYSENNGGGSISLSLLNNKTNINESYPLLENVHIYIENRKEILKCGIDDPIEAFNIITYLDTYPDFDERFLNFVDIDGENVMVNPEDLLILELPSEIYEEGFKTHFPDEAT